MLVTASRYGGSDYSYNTVTVVLLTESVKLVLSSAVYVKDKTAASLGEGILKNKKVDHDNHGHGDVDEDKPPWWRTLSRIRRCRSFT